MEILPCVWYLSCAGSNESIVAGEKTESNAFEDMIICSSMAEGRYMDDIVDGATAVEPLSRVLLVTGGPDRLVSSPPFWAGAKFDESSFSTKDSGELSEVRLGGVGVLVSVSTADPRSRG